MADRYANAVRGGLGAAVAKRLGLPRPTALRRYEPGQPLLDGPALVVGATAAAPLVEPVLAVLGAAGAQAVTSAAAEVTADGPRLAAVVVDASGVRAVDDLEPVRATLSAALCRLAPCARVLVLGTPPEDLTEPTAVAAQRALEGLVRSIGKELRAGATANLVYVTEGAGAAAASTLRFLLSSRSAYVDAQVVRVGAPAGGPPPSAPADAERPLAGKVAVVTGAARGIGAAIADVLARQGARVVAVDIPAAGQALAQVANQVGGTALQLDITAPDAGERIAEHVAHRYADAGGRVDVLVHNAGITRDKLLVNVDAERWASVLDVNLAAQLRIDDALLARGDAPGGFADGARVVSLSSQSGIAGNRGQTSYAASKAGVIGMVQARARQVADRGITVNAVAPGFIETEMTARMPLGTRELGRRVNSLSQGGLPVDVAETIAWLAEPASAGVTGQVVRVCGQSILGA